MSEGKDLVTFSLRPSNLQEAMEFSKIIADSDICPKAHKGKPGNVLVAIQMGQEVGLAPMQALQNIAVINGNPCIWGDALPALVKAHHSCVDLIEDVSDDGTTVTAKRKGKADVVRSFGVDNARTAGLLGKDTYKSYPARMFQMRARAWAIRDQWPDVLKGLAVAEEVMDIPVDPRTVVESQTPLSSRTAEVKNAVHQQLQAARAKDPEPGRIDAIIQEFNAANTADSLKAAWRKPKDATQEETDILTAAFKGRMAALKMAEEESEPAPATKKERPIEPDPWEKYQGEGEGEEEP